MGFYIDFDIDITGAIAMSDQLVISESARTYLRLHLTDGIGPVTMRRLVEHLGSAEDVLSASVDALRRVHRVGRATADAIRQSAASDKSDREIDLAAEHGVRIICPDDQEYPPLLKHTPDGPICLYVKGQLVREDAVSLAIVGSRNPTYYGQEQARHFSDGLSRMGMTIVSGLAYGIDACAHQAALSADGRTVAVLGNGLCDIYPPPHHELADLIAETGAVISELPMETAPDGANFPRRNRIIAGMSIGVLVVEGGPRSGAMITARYANEYNREVMAVPGRIDARMSVGPNTLIRTGAARLVMTVADVLDELGDVGRFLKEEGDKIDPPEPAPPVIAPPLTDSERQTLDAIGDEPVPMESVVDAANLPASEVAAALTTLQLKRQVKQLQGGMFVSIARG